MKKIFLLSLVSTVILLGSCVFAGNTISLIINGKQIECDTPPQIVGESTLVPVRAIFEDLGATVEWNAKTREVTGKKNGKTINIKINDKSAQVDGKSVKLDTPSMIINGSTMVPVRFIAESLGAKVEWEQDTQTVRITTGKEFFTYDKKFKITADGNWNDYADTDVDLSQYNLFIANNDELALAVLTINKSDLAENLDLNDYVDMIKKNYSKQENTKITSLPNITLNGYNAEQFEMTAEKDQFKFKYLLTVIDMKSYYNYILSWSRPSDYPKAKPEFVKIISTFNSVDSSNNEGIKAESQTTSSEESDNYNKLTTTQIGKKVDSVVYIQVTDYKGFDYTASGFIISADGKIVTNYHVIDKTDKIKIVLNNDKEYTENIKVLDYSKDKDIAVLKIDANNLSHCKLGDSDKVELGEDVVAIGSPKGLKNTLSTGIISGIREDAIQISAPISKGSSGGALFDMFGNVIGITSSDISSGQNLGFAIPINEFKKLKMDKNLTLLQLYKEVYGKDLVEEKISYKEYADYLYKYFWYFTTSDENYDIDYNDMELYESSINNSKNLIVVYYIDSDNKDTLDKALKEGYGKEVREGFKEVVDMVKEYYGNVNTIGYIVYKDKISENKSEFNVNQIKDFTNVKYNDSTKDWSIYYPYLKVYSTDYNKDGFSWNKMYDNQ